MDSSPAGPQAHHPRRAHGHGAARLQQALGLTRDQWARARAAGLIPAPDLGTSRWSDGLADQLASRRGGIPAGLPDDLSRGQLREALGLGVHAWRRAKGAGLISPPDRGEYWTRPAADKLISRTDEIRAWLSPPRRRPAGPVVPDPSGPGRPPAATLKQVAERARVHPGTASRALDPGVRHLVSEPTRRRVISAAEELGYLPNGPAVSLRTRRTRSVGVLLPDVADPLAAMFARGLEDCLAADGYVALARSTDCNLTRERKVLGEMRSRHVDGLILAGRAASGPLATAASRSGLPLVTVASVPLGSVTPAVSADLGHGVRMVVEHLAALGHRSIACLSGPGEDSLQRAFRAALKTAGLPTSRQVITTRALTAAEGLRCFGLLPHRPRCTAIVTTSDLLAAGCFQALAVRGLACPGDVSVTGAGDLPLADSMQPALTTIRLPQYQLGQQAARLLLQRIGDPGSPSGPRLLLPELVIRGSTAPPGSA